jgi:hypothetical protein
MESASHPVNLLIEGAVDEAVARRLLHHVGLAPGTAYGRSGKTYLLQRLPNYNQAARFMPWLVLVDLDADAECAPPFIQRALPNPAGGICFRVAVRAVEAWLMADAERLAAYLEIPAHLIPRNPDGMADPKTTLVNLARRSLSRVIARDMVPRQGSGAPVGPGYNRRISEFVASSDPPWRPEVAARHSESLRRCLQALASLKTWRPEE